MSGCPDLTVSETADALTVIRAGGRARDNLPRSLRRAGYDPSVPALVLTEGLCFFLPPRLTSKILDPGLLPLAPESSLIFDCWSPVRVDALNRRVRKKIGRGLFHRFPLDLHPPGLEDDLRHLGWSSITVEPLDPHAGAEDEFPKSWLLVEADRREKRMA